MLLEFYVLRNYMEPEKAVSESKDQRFNSFLKEARDYLENKGCKVVDNYKFRQVVDTFYEEAEFEQEQVRQRVIECEKNQVKQSEEALRNFSKNPQDQEPTTWGQLIAQRSEVFTENSSELPLSDVGELGRSSEETQFEAKESMRGQAKQSETPNQTPNSAFVESYQTWATFPKGINLIRNHVINPLLVATERIVEQWHPAQHPEAERIEQ